MKETKNVDLNHLGNELKSKIELLDITPIGLNHLCHNNANLFNDKIEGMSMVFGFNITACQCSKRMAFEIHSVNKYNGKLYDFTKDFNAEIKQYF
jgi:hypothetical protein